VSSRLRDTAHKAGVAPEFTVDPNLLDAISPSGDRGGIVLGQDANGTPLSIAALRSEPTRIVLVGGLYLARQVTLRAMAVGAWIVIATGREQAWYPIQQAAGTQPDGRPLPHVQIRRLSPVELPRASENAPLLVVHDGGPTPQDLFPPRAPWHTTIYVLPYLHPQATSLANSADLVLMQRLPVGQAELAARIWNLPPQMSSQLTGLQDDQVIALGRNLWRPFRLVTNSAREQQLLGPVTRD
jgi:hypothetical protein